MKKKDTSRVSIVTLGCSKNTVDSEALLRQLEASGLHPSHDDGASDARTVIINTCGFIGDAKQQSVETILQFAQAKLDGKIDKLIVMGCLAQRYRDELKSEIPEADAWFGVDETAAITGYLGADYRKDLVGERLLSTPSHFAYLKIAEGCDRKCSFCAIPLIRGKHVSRTIESLMNEAQHLASKGVKELILISQDLTYYGVDLYGKQMIAELVKQLSDSNLFTWIRLHYLFPTSFPEDLLPLMRERKNICKYIDIPLQHINTRILQSMRRSVTASETQRLIDKFRAELPDAAIRTSFIVGYPGETDDEFEELIEFIRLNRFDRVGVFTYSHEEDTNAYKLTDDIPEEIKQERAARLMEVQEQIALELNEKVMHCQFTVLVDRIEGDFAIARTQYDSPEVDNEVLIDRKYKFVKPGEFYQVRIDRVEQFDLFGTPLV